jgi:Domain of unknown function (DUF3520)
MKSENLTAWALNELPEDERLALEASPADHAQALEIAEFTALLSEHLVDPTVALRMDQRQALYALPLPGQRVAKKAQAAASQRGGLRIAAMAAGAVALGAMMYQGGQSGSPTADVAYSPAKIPSATDVKIRVAAPAQQSVAVIATARPMLLPTVASSPSIRHSLPPGPMIADPAIGSQIAARPDQPPVLPPVADQGGAEFQIAASAPAFQVAIQPPSDGMSKITAALAANRLPKASEISLSGLLNHFRWAQSSEPSVAAVQVQAELSRAPWNPDHQLARVVLTAASAAVPALAAHDVALKVEFNPEAVVSYRLLGEAPASGSAPTGLTDVAAGHQSSYLFEIIPVTAATSAFPMLADVSPGSRDQGGPTQQPMLTGTRALPMLKGPGEALLTVHTDCRLPNSQLVKTVSLPVAAALPVASADQAFAAALTGFVELLQKPKGERERFTEWQQVTALATQGANNAERLGFLKVIAQARALSQP